MAKQATLNDQQDIIECVRAEMSGLSAADKLAYCATRKCEYVLAKRQAQRIMYNASREAYLAGVHSSLVSFGICVPLMALYTIGGIPMEVGLVSGVGIATCLANAVYYKAKQKVTNKRIGGELATYQVASTASIAVCDDSREVREYKANLASEIEDSQQSK